MQAEILAANPESKIRILGVNRDDAASGVELAVEGNSIPLLQDTTRVGSWELWQVTYRDVVILDAENERVAVYNLTTHNLENPDDYAALLALLRQSAGE